jgi:catechol 2,3-dioxygenase
LFHLCFTVSDEQALIEIYNRCQAAGVSILGTSDHTVMRSFYVVDPDGHVVEFGFDVPQEEWGVPEPFARDFGLLDPEFGRSNASGWISNFYAITAQFL